MAAAQSATRTRIIIAVAGVLVAILAAVGVRLLFQAFAGDSKQEAIAKTVEQVKEENTLPMQVDAITSWDDVTAESEAIHYHYTVTGTEAETAGITEDAIEQTVLPTLCSTEETRDILDRDIGMNYSYEIESTGDTYDLAFTKADC